MRYRTLGNTGIVVSEVGFGTIPILKGSVPVLPDYYNLDDEEAIAVMSHAFRLGCNLFDTAIVPEYGDAEIKLGKFAGRIGRKHIIISDKARFYGGNEMYQAVRSSCENLNTYADLYFVHQVGPEQEEAVFQKGGALDALAEWKQQGAVRFVGVASHYYDILLRGAKDSRVDVLQGSGNLLERGMLERIKEEPLFRQKGFLANKVYGAGLLPAHFPVGDLLGAVLSYPVSCALVGIGSTKQADASMAESVPLAIPPFEGVLRRLEKEFTPIACDRCQRCRCPKGTEIHTVFRQYHYYFLGKDFWALKKLGLNMENSARWCRECVDMPCLASCPRKVRIPDEMQKVWALVKTHKPGFTEYHTV